ncbi:5-(carboxyamino)imidazole ribonucleotide synthase [Compostibacter hankyongensis]|uniref:N5-carboxyaminoimidazole ribonucleotide synthase n=1 Tax=Compostibacter hankyongensis TaxID=1007089 RepID=A0ABP8FPK0_9BACT
MKNIFSGEFKIGILGGGQLGKMLLQKAHDFNLHIAVLDPSANAPCRNLCNRFVQGDFKDFNTVYNFGKDLDLITIEFEDVNVEALEALEREGKQVYPQPAVLRIIQNKGSQKSFYQQHKIPTSPFVLIKNRDDIAQADIDFPVFQKLLTSGYDGYGVQFLENKNTLQKAFDAPSVLEQSVDLEKELSVIVARNAKGEVAHFPPVEMEFNPEANMVAYLFSPAGISPETEKKAVSIARTIVEKMKMVGLLAVEMFLSKKGELLVNEVAPRPHNSGHQSIEGNSTSQYEQHLRAILNLPIGNTAIIQPSVMVNLLGEKGYRGKAIYEGVEEVLKIDGAHIHLYGKYETRPFRKMGHVSIVAPSLEEAKMKAKKVKSALKVIA